MISTYLKTMKDVSEINLMEMYDLYLRGWNGDLDNEHPMSKAFKSGSAQELLILMESLYVILGNGEIDNNHLLLNGDENLWRSLGESKNWYEVGRHMRED